MRVASATGGKPDDAGLERALATLVPIADAAAGLAPHRFLVDEPETLWLVTHGRLNLFAVELHEGQPVGPRRFLWSAEAPSAVFGLAPAPAARPFAVLADAGAATVCRLPLAALRALGAQPEGASAALALVGSFVAEASAAMGRTRAPQLRHELAPGQ